MNFFPKDQELIDRRRNRIYKPVAVLGALAAAMGFALNLTNNKNASEEDLYQTIPGVTSINICDSAVIRDEPRVTDPNLGDRSNIMDKVDLGDSPENTCVAVNASAVYVHDDPFNGEWYGVPEEDMAKTLTRLKLGDKNKNIVWVNWQKAEVSVPETEVAKNTEK